MEKSSLFSISNPYLAAYHNELTYYHITNKTIMALRKSDYHILGQNGGLSNLTSCVILTGYRFRQGSHTDLYNIALSFLTCAVV